VKSWRKSATVKPLLRHYTRVGSFLQSHGLSLPVLLDKKGEVALGYNIRYFPTTFLINKNGVIEAGQIGAFQSKEEIERFIQR